ncbi:hypothetical protein [Bacillus sp. Marseille-P3800]|uniref:hypothetical protein n=1 Tax=Bacillus sp. Marseille-P3800 TaxID=2014782 RepID=UPI00159BEF31|nr:hypothetical protein [Bacillus sp. Marseille-P3800]
MKKMAALLCTLGIIVTVTSFGLNFNDSADKVDGRSISSEDKVDGRSADDKVDGR